MTPEVIGLVIVGLVLTNVAQRIQVVHLRREAEDHERAFLSLLAETTPDVTPGRLRAVGE